MNKEEEAGVPHDSKSTETKFGSEMQRMIAEAEQLARSVIFQLTLKQLNEFSDYFCKVIKDYQAQDLRWSERAIEEEVDFPIYRKLPGSESADWWTLAETLFNEDGGQSMSGTVVMFVQRFIYEALERAQLDFEVNKLKLIMNQKKLSS